jgi:hypothetical protein
VIEVEVGVDEEADFPSVDAESCKPSRDLISGLEFHFVDLSSQPEATRRIRLRIDVEAAVEEHLSPRVIDQIACNGNAQAAALALEKEPNGAGQPPARHREEPHAHTILP